MARLFIFALSFLLFLLRQLPNQVSSAVVLEYGYTVSTVFDGNKQRPTVHPFSLLPGTQDDALLLLDSSNNAFYTLSQDGKNINHLSGNGVAGFSDGDLTDATFNHPRSFAVDSKGNIYVADKNNHAIRKISKSELGVPLVCVVGVLCLLVGSIVGFVVRPFLTSRDISSHNDGLNKILKHCRTNLKGQVQIACSDIRNAVARSTPFMLLSRLVMLGLSDVFLIFEVFRPRKVVNPSQHAEPISLLDSDIVGNTEKQQDFADQLEDLVSFDDALKMEKSIERGDGDEKGDTSTLDKMIEDNILCFSNPTMKQEGLLKGVLGGSIGLAKRRGIEADNGH
ncbi:uncharacterized protein LOC131257943 isoform X3 [Magnolia sinica]|uniref:uncharacterized protein LOC131257943 isoform X3 n=1 Tax=Magnolia sinica TaxID=86752 RepID=UPI002657E5C1|nr:uncharacterized protein LOC131257943 isoform X3 [Magnolia sinica]